MSSRRLTTLDASFLYMETPAAPLNIGAVQVFDGPLVRSKFVTRLRGVMDRLPRYRQRVADAPLGLGLPFWEDDPEFDVANHVLETSVRAPGGVRELRECAARLLELPLSRQRPLWEVHVVHGLEGNRGALVMRIHHAMVDGLSGVAFVEALLDGSRAPASRAAAAGPQRVPKTGVTDRGLEVAWDAGRLLAAAIGSGLQTAARMAAAPRETLGHLSQITGELARAAAQPVERLPFNRPLTGGRRFSWVEWPLAAFARIREAAGGATLNDVVLAVIGDAVGRFVSTEPRHGGPRVFRAMVPVNLRNEDERDGMGNRVSILPIEIAFDQAPLERIRHVAARTSALKRAGMAETVGGFVSAAGLLPAPLVSLAVGLAANPALQSLTAPLRTSPWMTANAVCTNVPGPAGPLFAQGRRMLAHYPVVPLAFEFGLSFAIFSYDRRVFVGVIADAGVIDDLDPLTRHLDAAFLSVRAEAEVQPAERVASDTSPTAPRRRRPSKHR